MRLILDPSKEQNSLRRNFYNMIHKFLPKVLEKVYTRIDVSSSNNYPVLPSNRPSHVSEYRWIA